MHSYFCACSQTNLTNIICCLTARVVISAGMSDTDNHHVMPLDWTKMPLCFVLAVRRLGLQLALHSVWGKNMRLSKWPFPTTYRDCSNWHFLLLSTEANKNVLLGTAMSPFHKKINKRKVFWNVWVKMKYNIISCSVSTHVMSHR